MAPKKQTWKNKAKAAVLLSVYLIRVISKRTERVKEINTKISARSHLTLFACIRTAQRKLQVGGFQLSVFLFIQWVWGEPLAFVQILLNVYMLYYITVATNDMTIVCFFFRCFPHIHNRLSPVKLVRCFLFILFLPFYTLFCEETDTCTVQILNGDYKCNKEISKAIISNKILILSSFLNAAFYLHSTKERGNLLNGVIFLPSSPLNYFQASI